MRKKKISESGFKLLTINNAKTTLGEELGVLTGILYLNPAVTPKLCPYASEACRADCLVNAGRAEFIPAVLDARTRKTNMFLNNRQAFIALLIEDIRKLERKAKKLGLKAAVRLNGTSDILFERLIDFSQFPEIQFYDYTKVPISFRKLSSNYHLTFSYSGENWNECLRALATGMNVAIVFAKDIPNEYQGFKVFDATLHDSRFLDTDRGAIAGLCLKGNAAKKRYKEQKTSLVVEG